MTTDEQDAIARQAGEETGSTSSMELVETINRLRGEFDARLSHPDLMKVVRKVLGEAAAEFASQYSAPNGKKNPCYILPSDEAQKIVAHYTKRKYVRRRDMPITLEEIEANVEKTPDGCWLWRGGRNTEGYAQIKNNGKMVKGHRLVYELLNGQTDLHILHARHCLNRHCVSPAHLRAGTDAENTADKVACNRQISGPTKLTDAHVSQIRELRSRGMLCREIAQIFGISKVHVGQISRMRSRSKPLGPQAAAYVNAKSGNLA